MRIAQVMAGAEHGGAENFYTRLVTSLAERPQLNQSAFIRPHPERYTTLTQAGIDTYGFRFGGPLDLWDRQRYRRRLSAWHPDVVMTWMNRASRVTPRGPYTLTARLGHYYNLKYYRHCDHWVGNIRGICDYLVRHGMPADRVHQIPNFADEIEASALPSGAFDTPKGTPVILAAGRLHENKGFDVLIRALPAIPGAILWLAGDGPEALALQELARDQGVEARVRFLGWQPSIAPLLRSVDLFVCPSRHEGLGSVVLEAWFHGCPIVATASQGPAELIESGVTGLLTPVDEVAPLAAAINELLPSPQRKQALTQNARACYEQHYSREVVTAQYLSLFEQITPRR